MCLWLLFWLKAQTQNEALQALYHSKDPRKRGEVFSGSGSPSSCTHSPFSASAEGSDAALPGHRGAGGCSHTSGRDTAKVTHCRKGFTENLLLRDCVSVNIEFIQQQHISRIYSTFNKSMKQSNTVPAGEKRNPLNTFRETGIWLVKQSSTQRIKVSGNEDSSHQPATEP